MFWVDMSYFRHHIFFCTNKRTDGSMCCENFSATKLRAYAKKKIKSLHLSDQNKVRVNTAGCLDRCKHGPVAVVYPEAVWYTYIDQEDIDDIIDEHLLKHNIVNRLLIDTTQ